jgi:hypothetical protein
VIRLDFEGAAACSFQFGVTAVGWLFYIGVEVYG